MRTGWMLLFLCGCAAEAPPLEELPLRDTLGAEPEALAALGDDDRAALAERFESALDEERDGVVAPAEEMVPWPEVELRHADGALEDRGDDAFVAGVLVTDDEGVHLWPWKLSGAGDATELPALGGLPADSTEELETLALETRAGEIVAELMAESGAVRLVRVTGWPAGALAYGDAVYVNAAWLVAMSPFSAAPVVPAVGAPRSGEPPSKPLALAFNPYRLPGSLAVCAGDVREHCSCVESGACHDEPPIDPRFASAAEECAWVAADPVHPDVLCILWLMSIEAIAECMPDACQVSSVDDALFVARDEACRSALDNCVRGEPAVESDGCDSDCGPDCGTPECSSPDCSSCEQSCDSCEQSCDNVGDSCDGACDSTSDSCDSACDKTCTVAPPPKKHGATAFWLLAPLAYLFLCARRLA